jgi:hypothetical protein
LTVIERKRRVLQELQHATAAAESRVEVRFIEAQSSRYQASHRRRLAFDRFEVSKHRRSKSCRAPLANGRRRDELPIRQQLQGRRLVPADDRIETTRFLIGEEFTTIESMSSLPLQFLLFNRRSCSVAPNDGRRPESWGRHALTLLR